MIIHARPIPGGEADFERLWDTLDRAGIGVKRDDDGSVEASFLFVRNCELVRDMFQRYGYEVVFES